MPALAPAKEAPIENPRSRNASNAGRMNSTFCAAINPAPNSMIGSKPKRRFRKQKKPSPKADHGLIVRTPRHAEPVPAY